MRKRAEEEFKNIQEAYTALREHQTMQSEGGNDNSEAASGSSEPSNHTSDHKDEDAATMKVNPDYIDKWNWAAFFLTGFWAISKDLRGGVLIWVGALILIFNGNTPFGLSLLMPVLLMSYFGARGNSLHYKKIVLGDSWAFGEVYPFLRLLSTRAIGTRRGDQADLRDRVRNTFPEHARYWER